MEFVSQYSTMKDLEIYLVKNQNHFPIFRFQVKKLLNQIIMILSYLTTWKKALSLGLESRTGYHSQ